MQKTKICGQYYKHVFAIHIWYLYIFLYMETVNEDKIQRKTKIWENDDEKRQKIK